MRTSVAKSGTKVVVFDSVAECLGYIDPDSYRKSSYEDWVGKSLASYEDAVKASFSVWEHGAKVLRECLTKLKAVNLPELKSRQRKLVYSTENGDEIDLDRMRSGQPYWRESVREEVAGPSEVTIIIDTGATGNYSSESMLWRGAAAIALACLLEERGYRAEIWATNCGDRFSGSRELLLEAVNLKKTSDPLDTNTLINATSGWFYRSIGFSLHSTYCSKNHRELDRSYGRSRSASYDDLDEISRDANRIYSSGMFSFEGAVSLMEAEINKLARRGQL